jgi:hypothetical protein
VSVPLGRLGLFPVMLLVATLLCTCGNPSECAIGAERCQDRVPQFCIQNPTLSEGVGVWVEGESCATGLVCRVDKEGAASCVPP